jgi:hypothetical protein
MNRKVKQNAVVQSNQQVRHLVKTALSEDMMSVKSPCCSPLKAQCHYPLSMFQCSHVSLGSPPSLPVMRHTSTHVAPPLQYAVPRGGWFLLSQRQKTPIAGNSSFTDYAPGLSIKSNNYILPYSLQILTLLLLLDDKSVNSL